MPRWPKKEEVKTVRTEKYDGKIIEHEVEFSGESIPVDKKEVETKAEPVKEKLEPLQPGQRYFEAPTGEIIVGEATKSQIWFRKLNNGKGGWINPRR